ncbi:MULTISPECIES: NAD(P)-dependent oxidoreductase [Microbacterium]|uniref:NAD(P)-dependent oxidoreductase n=1 Tax=Microbacterium TaxID=33882 RepID=UPI00217DEA23|nr:MULTISPECIES: NAD(P)H-binding protein [Microbacterium]UWF77058.1 NAD(P)H-binding protein [Microbacterium neungamense]WCM55218.1 NAD(P)H-binding protein [Microbacterium sp. EF45047]
MARIVVVGGTGYAGSHIVREAVSRGHEVVSVSRTVPDEPIEGVEYVQGSVLDIDALGDVFDGADAVISAVSPRGDMADKGLDAVRALATKLTGTSTRLGVVGGAMGSLAAPGGPRLWDLGVPEEYRHEAQVGIDTLELLQQSEPGLDWFLVHPPKVFGSWEPGERTGRYRTGGEVVVEAEDGTSYISGADFAVAVVDEIERPAHRRARFTVGY